MKRKLYFIILCALTLYDSFITFHALRFTVYALRFFDVKQRHLNVDRPAGRAFARFCEAVALLKNEAAMPAGGADHFKMPVALT